MSTDTIIHSMHSVVIQKESGQDMQCQVTNNMVHSDDVPVCWSHSLGLCASRWWWSIPWHLFNNMKNIENVWGHLLNLGGVDGQEDALNFKYNEMNYL